MKLSGLVTMQVARCLQKHKASVGEKEKSGGQIGHFRPVESPLFVRTKVHREILENTVFAR